MFALQSALVYLNCAAQLLLPFGCRCIDCVTAQILGKTRLPLRRRAGGRVGRSFAGGRVGESCAALLLLLFAWRLADRGWTSGEAGSPGGSGRGAAREFLSNF